MANDDTEGMTWIDKRAQEELAKPLAALHQAGGEPPNETTNSSVTETIEEAWAVIAGLTVERNMWKQRAERAADKIIELTVAAREPSGEVRRLALEEAAQHYPTNVVNRGERSASVEGWTQCACGEAVADGITPYKTIWQAHIRALSAAAGPETTPCPYLSQHVPGFRCPNCGVVTPAEPKGEKSS